MAITAEGHALTEAHRQIQVRINAVTLRDLLSLWRVVDVKNLRGTVDPFVHAAVTVTQHGRRASSTASARYYTAFRQAEGVPGSSFITAAPAPPEEVVAGAIRGGALSGIANGFRRGFNGDAALANGFVKASGSASALVVGGGRATIMGAIQSDHQAVGWQRVTDGDPCAFCSMIASQGIVYKGEDTAEFEAHGHCLCTAEPAYEGSKINPANARARDAWDAATQGLGGTDALNAYRRALGK